MAKTLAYAILFSLVPAVLDYAASMPATELLHAFRGVVKCLISCGGSPELFNGRDDPCNLATISEKSWKNKGRLDHAGTITHSIR